MTSALWAQRSATELSRHTGEFSPGGGSLPGSAGLPHLEQTSIFTLTRNSTRYLFFLVTLFVKEQSPPLGHLYITSYCGLTCSTRDSNPKTSA